MVKSKTRFTFIRFKEPFELVNSLLLRGQERRLVTEVHAIEGYLITRNLPDWIQIRKWRDGKWLDYGGGWVQDSLIAELIPYEYPEGTKIFHKHYPDHLYPELYPRGV